MNTKELEQWKSELRAQYNGWKERYKEAEEESEKVYVRLDKATQEQKQRMHDVYAERCKCSRWISRLEPYLNDKWYFSQYLWSDVHAFEVVEIKTRKLILVRQLKATITPKAQGDLQKSFVPGGFVGHFDNDAQDWTFESDESNPILDIRLHDDGNWYRPHQRTCPFRIHKEPYEFRDFNF